jgi:hypothetical protein
MMLPQAQQAVCNFFVIFWVVGNVFVIFGFVGEMPRGWRIIWKICAIG